MVGRDVNVMFCCVCLLCTMASQCSSDEPKDSLKRFVFSSKDGDFVDDEKLEIVIPEVDDFVDGRGYFGSLFLGRGSHLD